MSRFASLRASMRALSGVAPTQVVARRAMSSTSHGAQSFKTNDTIWQVAGAVLTVSGFSWVYLRPRGDAHAAHGDSHGHSEHHSEPATPVTDDEGTELPADKVNASIEQAIDEDSPKEDAHPVTPEPKNDKEESAPPAKTDDAYVEKPESSEPKEDKEEDQKKPSGDKPEPKGKAGGPGDHGSPTDLGEARKAAKDDAAPKEAAKDAKA